MLPLPFVTTHGQPLKVPAPFNHVSFRRHNRNQPERTQLAQRQLPYAVCDLIRARFAGERPDDLSPTNNIVLRFTCDTVPVNQRRHTPASLAAIHVPPSGSRGKIARRSARSTIAGGTAVERVNFSSRFIAR